MGECSSVSPWQWKPAEAAVSYALTMDVGVGPGAAVESQAAGTSIPSPSLVVEDEIEEQEERDSVDGNAPVSTGEDSHPFRNLIAKVREFLGLPEPSSHPSMLQTGVERASGALRLVPPPLVLPRSPLAHEVRREQEECSLRNLGAASTRLSLPRRWGLRVDRWYTPEGSSGGAVPLNDELQHLANSNNLSVSIPWRLATQIEGVLSGIMDISSWMDQVLGAFAGMASEATQEVFDCLNALARANADIMQPSEILRLRMLMLRRQAVVGCLPRTYGDRDRRQLLSSPMGPWLFDAQTLVAAEQREQDSAQRSLVSHLARGLASAGRAPRVGARVSRKGGRSSSVPSRVSPRSSVVQRPFQFRGSRRGGSQDRRGSR